MNRRVLIFSTAYFPLVGGAEVAVKETTDRLPDWTFDLICARLRPGLLDTEKIGNVTVHRVGFGVNFDKFLLPVLGVWKALRLSGPRETSIWSILASYAGYAAVVYAWIRPSSKILLTLMEGDPFEQYARRAGVLAFTRHWIFRRANEVHILSHFLGDWAKQMGYTGTPVIIPNGVDVARFAQRISSERRAELRRTYGFEPTDTVVVTVSRLSLKNAVDDVIRALPILPDSVKFLIAGEGEDGEMLRALVRELGVVSRVVFLGKKPHSELPEILQSADIFIRASLSEAFGNSFPEAMAAGIPIIGTPVGGIPDFLIDGQTGVFCQPRDPASIAKAILRIQTEPGLHDRLAQQAEKLVRERYDWNGIAHAMNDLLTRLTV